MRAPNMPMLDSAQDRNEDVTRSVLDMVLLDGEPLVIISAPPGAGKTRLIEILVTVLARYAGLRVVVAMPRLSQLYELLDRLLANYTYETPLQVLLSSQRALPEEFEAQRDTVIATSDVRLLARGSGIVLATAAKLFEAMPRLALEFDVLVCEESWQLGYHALSPLFATARQTVMVGDPGQLEPLVRTSTAIFDAAPIPVHLSAPDVMVKRYPRAIRIQLPYSYRLPQDSVNIIQPLLYPGMLFRSASGERRLALSKPSANDGIDRALDLIAEGASIVAVTLPAASTRLLRADDELAELEATIVKRMLDRRARVGNRVLVQQDFGGINTRVAEGAALRERLRRTGLSTDSVMVDTPENWQGLERPVIVARHPLSGRSRLSTFDVELGRLCVMLSRHSTGLALTYREGIEETLQTYKHDCSARELGIEDRVYTGWSVHRALLAQLTLLGRIL